MPELLNPYIAGAPVTEASMFFGRQDVFDWIERSLAGKYVDHILVVHGQRRVGKTSVLKQIPHHLPQHYIQVYLDFQGRAGSSLDRFLWWMAREILRSLRGSTGVTISAPEQSAFTQDPDYFHTTFLPALSPILEDRVLLLTFDEFDILSQPETMHSLGIPLTGYLSRLFELENLSFIFSIGSSGKKLENMQAAYTEFFKAALYKKISFLEQAECYRLVTQPVIGALSYDPGAVQRIYRITSGHPYYTQLICHELFSACQKDDKRRITSADVDAVLPDVIERGTVNLKFIWDEAADLEKWALACLAHGEGVADSSLIAAELSRQHVRFSEADLNSALLHLQEKDVLRPDLGFIVHLLRLWLQVNRPLGRVREELQEINPIADRFIEIGDEYRDRASPQDAIQSYQQALSVDPSNLRAQVSLAAIYLSQNGYTQAADAYAHALEIDPEDVQARSGFCLAHLELGEAALIQQDTASAIDHLRQVVAVNPDHTEVRQRLADILCQQAEQMLAAGRDEDALKAIHAARGYAPEDEALYERYNQVCTQVKGRVLASLLERASAEWKRQNWSEAIASLEEYLEFEPDSGEVRTRLEDLRIQQRQLKLSSLKAQAQSLERTERWEEAIVAWQEYLVLQPEDRPQAEAAMQAVQRNRSLQEVYTQAQTALRQKEYSRAIPLLQGIIAQEPSYKDTARLLAEAIVKERARRPVWKQRWVWAALVFVLLFAITGVFGPRMLETFSLFRSPADPGLVAAEARGSQTTSPQVSPTSIVETAPAAQATQPGGAPPTATAAPPATPVPAWIADFGQPAMLYITSHEPDFQDDFTEAKSGWQLSSWSEAQGETALTYADSVSDGALRLVKPRLDNLSLISSSLKDSDFALQFNLEAERGGDASPQVVFRRSEAGDYTLRTSATSPGGQDNWWLVAASQAGEQPLVQSYSPAIDYQKDYKVLLIAHGDQIAVYFNGQPAGYVQDSAFIDGDISLDFAGGFGGGVENRFVIDNLSYWKLPEDLALTADPAWVEDFVQPLEEQIRGKSPDFQDDFSDDQVWTNSYGLPVEKTGVVQSGAMRLSAANGESAQPLPRLATDFVLEIDFHPGDLAGKDALFALDLRGDEGKGHYRFEIDPEQNTYRLKKPLLSTGGTLAEGSLPAALPGGSASLQAFVSGSRLAFLWNDSPLASVTDNAYQGALNDIALSVPSGSAAVDIESIKLWDLNPIEQLPWVETFARPLLNSIRDRQPDFEDDFSSVKPEWILSNDPGSPRIISVDKYVKGGVFSLDKAIETEYSVLYTSKIQAHDYIMQFDLSADNYVSSAAQDRFSFNKKNIAFTIAPIINECWVEGHGAISVQKRPCTSGSWKDRNQIIFISSGERVGIYLNGEPLGYVDDIPDAGLSNYFRLGGWHNQATFTLDNIKFWNLDSQ